MDPTIAPVPDPDQGESPFLGAIGHRNGLAPPPRGSAVLERRAIAAALGLATLAQALCFTVVVCVVGLALARGGTGAADHLAIGIAWLVVLTLAGTLLCAVAQAALIWHANETPELDSRGRQRWLIRLTLWGPVVMPAYWRRYVRR